MARLAKLKETLDAERLSDIRTRDEKIAELEGQVIAQRSTIEQLTADASHLHAQEQNRLSLQAAAITAAVAQLKDEFARERERFQEERAAQKQRHAADVAAQLEEARRLSEVSLVS
jgi:allantoicase